MYIMCRALVYCIHCILTAVAGIETAALSCRIILGEVVADLPAVVATVRETLHLTGFSCIRRISF